MLPEVVLAAFELGAYRVEEKCRTTTGGREDEAYVNAVKDIMDDVSRIVCSLKPSIETNKTKRNSRYSCLVD